eukprot:GHUV01039524.1.p2 GENE.GHUV01039524.1~~GHUV01039524.1.p2  ORF type:complete len:161 (-),score=21.87 GHUV01039524.1:198-680(-)
MLAPRPPAGGISALGLSLSHAVLHEAEVPCCCHRIVFLCNRTNVFFVNNVLGVQPFGHHATMQGPDKACQLPCKGVMASATNATLVPDVILDGRCAKDTPNTCLGTKIPFEQALAATFLEGILFLLVCITGWWKLVAHALILRSIYHLFMPGDLLLQKRK